MTGMHPACMIVFMGSPTLLAGSIGLLMSVGCVATVRVGRLWFIIVVVMGVTVVHCVAS
jgi:hypothetical protein